MLQADHSYFQLLAIFGENMLKRFIVSIFLFFSVSLVWASVVPRYALELNNYSDSRKSGEQMTRLRITVVGEVLQPEQSVRVGDMLLCSPAQCYRAHTSGYTNIANTANGKANVIADVLIPAVTITDVYFNTIGGRSVIDGHLNLNAPFSIEKDFPGVELMIAVQKQQTGAQASYLPVHAASMYFTDDSELVHYLPSTKTVAELSLGTKLTLPAGALDQPKIFNIGVAKVGEMFPKIDVLPYINLKKPGNIEVRALRSSATHEFIVPVDPVERNDDSRMMNVPAAQYAAKVTFSRTAVIEPSTFEKALLGASSSTSNLPSAVFTTKVVCRIPCATHRARDDQSCGFKYGCCADIGVREGKTIRAHRVRVTQG